MVGAVIFSVNFCIKYNNEDIAYYYLCGGEYSRNLLTISTVAISPAPPIPTLPVPPTVPELPAVSQTPAAPPDGLPVDLYCLQFLIKLSQSNRTKRENFPDWQ